MKALIQKLRPLFPYAVFAAVAGQLLWLGINYWARTVELRAAPKLHIACEPYDPRDLVRGYYHMLTCNVQIPLDSAVFGDSIWWGKALLNDCYSEGTLEEIETLPSRPPRREGARELTGSGYRNEALELTVFWTLGEKGLHEVARIEALGSPEDVCRPGEIRQIIGDDYRIDYTYQGNLRVKQTKTEPSTPGAAPQTVEKKILTAGDLKLEFWPVSRDRLDYYISERNRDFSSVLQQNYSEEELEKAEIKMTIAFALCVDRRPIPTMFYLNGIPYEEAVERMRKKDFPLQ